jgi:tetratricopeptide (TPR) repeat protein
MFSVVLFAGGVQASDADNTTVLGVNPRLSDGARALEFRNYADGVRLTREGLRAEPSARNRAAGLSNLCAGYAGLGRFAEALSACDEALSIRGGNWRVYNNRAIANLGLGRLAAAREDLEQGLMLNPGSPTLLKVLDLIEARALAPEVTMAEADGASPAPGVDGVP